MAPYYLVLEFKEIGKNATRPSPNGAIAAKHPQLLSAPHTPLHAPLMLPMFSRVPVSETSWTHIILVAFLVILG